MSNSYTPPDRSTYDPGWNDPPPMPGASAETKPARAKLSLNKRIAFPMSGTSGTTTSTEKVKTTSEGLPLPFSTAKYKTPPSVFQPAPVAPAEPPPTSIPLPPPSIPRPSNEDDTLPPVAPSLSATSDASVDLSTAREYCQLIFNRLADAMASKLDDGKMVEIRKRLDILNGMWLEEKLDRPTQIDLHRIAKALDANNVEEAKEFHRQLVVNHINACSQWGTALRQVILSLDDTHAGERNAQDGPAVLPDAEVYVVQFLNVSSAPHVFDAIPSSFNPNPVIGSDVPADLNTSNSTLAETNTENAAIETDAETTSRSKTSRFGKILHI